VGKWGFAGAGRSSDDELPTARYREEMSSRAALFSMMALVPGPLGAL
jgi:hypothetical protein